MDYDDTATPDIIEPKKKSDIPKNQELEKKFTLGHTPKLSKNFELFSTESEHNDAQEKSRKRNAIIGYASGIVTLFSLGIIGFFSSDQTTPTENFYASAFEIPYSLEKTENLEICMQMVEKNSSTEIEREEGKNICTKKFSTIHSK